LDLQESEALKDCIFCNIEENRVLIDSNSALAVYDGYPVTRYHTLIIPREHKPTFFELTYLEQQEVFMLLDVMRERLEALDSSITGFNIGMNCGESAGQTIMHCHVHLIPRRDGDHPNPRGGVRAVIPGKADY